MHCAHIRASNSLFAFDKGSRYEAEITVPNLCQSTMPLSHASSQFCSSSLLLLSYSETLIIRTPLAAALMLAYRISEIVRITEVLSFLTKFMMPSP